MVPEIYVFTTFRPTRVKGLWRFHSNWFRVKYRSWSASAYILKKTIPLMSGEIIKIVNNSELDGVVALTLN